MDLKNNLNGIIELNDSNHSNNMNEEFVPKKGRGRPPNENNVKKIKTSKKPKKKSFECDKCKKVLATSASLTRHIKQIHLRLKPHSCNICKTKDTKYFLARDLRRHLFKIHGIETCNKCNMCSRKFFYKNDLTRHLAKGNN